MAVLSCEGIVTTTTGLKYAQSERSLWSRKYQAAYISVRAARLLSLSAPPSFFIEKEKMYSVI